MSMCIWAGIIQQPMVLPSWKTWQTIWIYLDKISTSIELSSYLHLLNTKKNIPMRPPKNLKALKRVNMSTLPSTQAQQEDWQKCIVQLWPIGVVYPVHRLGFPSPLPFPLDIGGDDRLGVEPKISLKKQGFLEKSNKGAKTNKYMDFLMACSKKVNPVFEHIGKDACFFVTWRYSFHCMRQVKKSTFRVLCFLPLVLAAYSTVAGTLWKNSSLEETLLLSSHIKPVTNFGKLAVKRKWQVSTIHIVGLAQRIHRSRSNSFAEKANPDRCQPVKHTFNKKHLRNKAGFKVLRYTDQYINFGEGLEIPVRNHISPSNVIAMPQATVQEHRDQSSHWQDQTVQVKSLRLPGSQHKTPLNTSDEGGTLTTKKVSRKESYEKD